MLAFAPDGREHLAKGDRRGAILSVGTVEQERTSRPRLIVVNFRRHERLYCGDGSLRVMRKMNGVIAKDESCVARAVGAGVRPGDDNAAIGRCDVRVAERVGRCGKLRPRRNRNEWAGGSDKHGDMLPVSKAITFAGHAEGAVTEATESRRDCSLPKRFAFNGNTARRKRLVSARNSAQCRCVHAVHKGLCTAGKCAGHERPLICGCCEAATLATKCSTRRVFAELLSEVLVDTATVASASRCRTRADRCPMATEMPE